MDGGAKTRSKKLEFSIAPVYRRSARRRVRLRRDDWVAQPLRSSAEGDRHDHEPTPPDRQPGDDIAQPVHTEQRSADRDRDRDE